MAKRYTRQEFLDRLRAEIAARQAAGDDRRGQRHRRQVHRARRRGHPRRLQHRLLPHAGLRLAGRHAAHGRRQRDGLTTWAEREVLPQVKETPVIAGLNGVDVAARHAAVPRGHPATSASPACTISRPWPGSTASSASTLEGTGLGYEHEIDMLNIARELDLLTIGYAFNEEDTERLMNEAAPDIFIFHAGITRGGSTGYAGGRSLEDTAERSQAHYDIAREIKPDVILLAHGAALVEPGGRAVHARPHRLPRRAARLEHRADGDRSAAAGAGRLVQERSRRVPERGPVCKDWSGKALMTAGNHSGWNSGRKAQGKPPRRSGRGDPHRSNDGRKDVGNVLRDVPVNRTIPKCRSRTPRRALPTMTTTG